MKVPIIQMRRILKSGLLKASHNKETYFLTREAPMDEACLVPDDDNLCMGQRVMFFRPLDASDSRYILYSIYGPLDREYIDSKNKGSIDGYLKLG